MLIQCIMICLIRQDGDGGLSTINAHRHAECFAIITTETAQALFSICFQVWCPFFCRRQNNEEKCMFGRFFVSFSVPICCSGNGIHKTIYKPKELKRIILSNRLRAQLWSAYSGQQWWAVSLKGGKGKEFAIRDREKKQNTCVTCIGFSLLRITLLGSGECEWSGGLPEFRRGGEWFDGAFFGSLRCGCEKEMVFVSPPGEVCAFFLVWNPGRGGVVLLGIRQSVAWCRLGPGVGLG